MELQPFSPDQTNPSSPESEVPRVAVSTIPPASEPPPPTAVPTETAMTGMPELLLTAIPPVSGLIASSLWLGYVQTSAEAGGFLQRLFLPEGSRILQLVPQAIVILFVWLVVDLALRGLALLRRRQGISQIEKDWEREGTLTPHRIRNPEIAMFLVPLLSGLSLTEASSLFQQQMGVESARSEGRYTIAHLFIWAMPILGFIGTVLGIGLAIGGFSGLLQSDIDDIEVIKAGLASVAGGLSFAFDTTLLGLGGSLVAMILTTLVQRQDRALLANLEALGLQVAHRLDAEVECAAPVRLSQEPEPVADWIRQQFATEATRLEQLWKDATTAVLSGLQPFTHSSEQLALRMAQDAAQRQEWTTRFETLLQVMERHADAGQVGQEQLAAITSLRDVTSAHFDRMAEAQAAQLQQLTLLVEQQSVASQLSRRLEEGIHLQLGNGR